MKKRFLLFFGYDAATHGGAEDFAGAFARVLEAKERISDDADWGNILDTQSMSIVSTYRGGKWHKGNLSSYLNR